MLKWNHSSRDKRKPNLRLNDSMKGSRIVDTNKVARHEKRHLSMAADLDEETIIKTQNMSYMQMYSSQLLYKYEVSI